MFRREILLQLSALPVFAFRTSFAAATSGNDISPAIRVSGHSADADDLSTLETCVAHCRRLLRREPLRSPFGSSDVACGIDEVQRLCSQVLERTGDHGRDCPALCQACADACARMSKLCPTSDARPFDAAATVCRRAAGRPYRT